ncbi:LacI family DNA-binding transcriptional regulator [Bifidobacterium imperatoris]|uniref:LacI family DNA-binding transcriptional regulator n=1 Tax=Bifidobacterium imperatoris TaxID=2020965 RepID=A0A2N5IUV1_9BIFI|nr:LacI family DNA-binding transcriptional regulator [Bifidobacterium imperatoris]PLS25707.1 LacI family transcriptional regulator [Bifidobacterium imperatoris]QSY58380.1 LacI family DNA-binding transcriptional regulator [Bifidobacterium imperatoris]
MVTLKDVGELAGVTATTASAALRGKDYVKPETMQRVKDAARKLGYKTNLSGRSLRSGRSDTITFLTSGIEGDYFSNLAMCVAEEVHERGSHMLVELSRYLSDDNDLSYSFSDGIIAINAPRAVDILRHHPAVLLENYDTSLQIDTVNAPSDTGSRVAVRHLIERGCKRIGIVGDNRDPSKAIIPGSRDIRMHAAADEIAKAGLKFDEKKDFITCAWSIDGGIEAGRAIAKSRTKYDGLYCLNDGIAIGVLRGLADAGVHVPDDVLVIGFDGLAQGAYAVPTLTTVATDFKGMANTALTMLMRRIEHPDEEFFPQTVSVGYKLIERESTRR